MGPSLATLLSPQPPQNQSRLWSTLSSTEMPTPALPMIYKSPVGEGEEKGGPGYPASLLVTREDFRWGRSCGVGMWSPVTRFLSGPALGSCLFFILALAML